MAGFYHWSAAFPAHRRINLPDYRELPGVPGVRP
jgi:hypothetical protein